MALPKLNDTPKYSLTIPSTKEKIKFRPYLVKEEKVLMMAFESRDQRQTLNAIVDTLSACIQEEIDTSTLTTFDIEYMFTQIRSKSVGESSTINLKCSSCSKANEVTIDVSSAVVDIPDVKNIIEITPSILVEMQYPSYRNLLQTDLDGEELEVGFEMVMNCIKAIHTEEERIETSDVSREEVREFVESMTQSQFKLISDYLSDLPSLKKEVEFVCNHCGEENQVVLKGMSDFLS